MQLQIYDFLLSLPNLFEFFCCIHRFLVDICLIYAMVSFLAVIVISKVYMGVYEEKRHNSEFKSNKIDMEGEETHGNT